MVTTYKDLHVYKNGMQAALEIFRLTKQFPREEKYSLTDQIRRSSRSVCANLAEAWRKRRYRAAFIAKLNDSESEAAETQFWLDMAHQCGYLSLDLSKQLEDQYDQIMGQLVRMIDKPEPWLIRQV